MKIFEVAAEEEMWIVIAEDEDKAIDFVIKDNFYDTLDDDFPTFEVVEKRDLKEGIVLSYDYEDMYWSK